MTDKNINLGVRLKAERDKLGLTQQQVADLMGESFYQETISQIEAGRDVKAWELAKLARIYHRDFNYFLEETVTSQMESRIIWRAKAENKPLIEQRFLQFIENYERLDKLVGTKRNKFRPVQWTEEEINNLISQPYPQIENLALRYQRELNLGSRPACVLPKILEEELAIKLYYCETDSAGSAASTVNESFGPAIMVNASDTFGRRNYDIAHEFFHLITWFIFSDEQIYGKNNQKSDVEKWAEAFSSAILLPAEAVRIEFEQRLKEKKISYFDLSQLAREFNVSIDALLWRLVTLRLLARPVASEVLDKGLIKSVYYSMVSSGEEKPCLSEYFIGLAIKAFQMGRISKGKLAEYLEKPFGEVSMFLKKHGYDENEDYTREFTAT